MITAYNLHCLVVIEGGRVMQLQGARNTNQKGNEIIYK